MAKAIRRESNQAVAHWWGVDPQTVSKWRRLLGVERATEGTSRLHSDYTSEPWAVEAFAKAQSKNHDPERCRKISEYYRGKPKPKHVIEALHKGWRERGHTEGSRRKISEALRRRGALVPGTVVWTATEDELVRTLPVEEAARRTGRSLIAVYTRRGRLQVPDGRRKK